MPLAGRTLLVQLIAESVAVLPQAVLASLPERVYLVLFDNIYNPNGEELSAAAAYPVHHGFGVRYTVMLNVNRGWGVPLQDGYFFDREGGTYEGLDYHRNFRFEELLLHEFAHLIDDLYQITNGVYWVNDAGTDRDGWRPNPVARWWEFRQLERESPPEFVSDYAATNVSENFAETFVAWAVLRSGRLNPYRRIGLDGCTVSEHIRTKMPLELDWWDRQGRRALFSTDGSLFACEPYLDTDTTGIVRVDNTPDDVDRPPMPCESFRPQ